MRRKGKHVANGVQPGANGGGQTTGKNMPEVVSQVVLARQLQDTADARRAVVSSKAFLSRGFRDIEMLLEAGFQARAPPVR